MSLDALGLSEEEGLSRLKSGRAAPLQFIPALRLREATSVQRQNAGTPVIKTPRRTHDHLSS